ELLANALAPALGRIGFPADVLPLALLRPISGSGSLAALEQILAGKGPDSLSGLVASVLQSSTETTFYTITVYYGSIKIKKTRHTLAAAAAGDITGIILASLMVQTLFGR
ncbi:MAG: spore maturation protein, partial [Oscillospiraceae bacterium]|nr:spore maturation protein [Oscillospiraceae bacterium]